MTTGYFPPDIIAAARESQSRWDIPASVCLAQWALESAFGSSMPKGSNNPFGIKAVGTQASVLCLTHEEVEGRLVVVSARFRAFACVADAFLAHAELLATSSHYAKARLLRHDPDAFAEALTGVYATDSRYGEKLVGLMRTSRLYEYDAPETPTSSSPTRGSISTASAASTAGSRPTWLDRLRTAFSFSKAA